MVSLAKKIFEHSNTLRPDKRCREEVRAAFIDTISVIYAGWNEPVTGILRNVYGAVPAPLDARSHAPAPELAGLIWGTAAHALDFDDVHTTSVTHPSAVLVPAIMAAVCAGGASSERQASAYVVGLATNVALGEALGFDHYARGWHATSTIGPVAAAAAVAHLQGADERQFQSALSIAVSQAAGTQRNFGTMAKPLHAGLAAAAGVRAARLAMAGLEAARDAFGEKGFIDLYGTSAGGVRNESISLKADAASVSRKLYPCCYMAHRPIAAALDMRSKIEAKMLHEKSVSILVGVPYGCTKALRVHKPSTGLEAKFSGPYTVASALVDGRVDLATFEDNAVNRPEIVNVLERVSLVEDSSNDTVSTGIDHGDVRITISQKGSRVATSTVAHYPGSPSQPATVRELGEKLADCLRHFHKCQDERVSPESVVSAANQFAGLDLSKE